MTQGDIIIIMTSDEWYGISNPWLIDCLFNSLLRLTTKKTSKFLIAGPFWRDSLEPEAVLNKFCDIIWHQGHMLTKMGVNIG